MSSLSSKWKEIHGANNWKGLLDPLDADLRKETIKFGELIEVVYDALDEEPDSKFPFYSFFGKSKLFLEGGLGSKPGYTITRYVYSTQKTGFLQIIFGPTKSVWMGYVAVSDDEETARIGRRNIVVVFRGTQRNIEWVYNCRLPLVPFPNRDGSTHGVPRVHEGFLGLYNLHDAEQAPFGTTSLREQILSEVERLLGVYAGEEVSITVMGHSLGAALANLCAYDIAKSKANAKGSGAGSAPVAAFTYASPMSGGEEFKQQAEGLVKILRLADRRDVVTKVPPPSILFKHVGVEWKVDGSQSPFIKFFHFWEMFKPHNLEGYLHTVAGIHKPYVTPPSVLEKAARVLPAPAPVASLPLFGGAISKVTGTVTGTATTVAGAAGSLVTTVLPVDELVKKAIGDDPAGLDVYTKLQQLFFDDLGALQEFLLDVLGITPEGSGKSDNFKLEVDRDIALVNKRDDLLKDEHGIPKTWWVIRNRAMEQDTSSLRWLARHMRPADSPGADNPDFL